MSYTFSATALPKTDVKTVNVYSTYVKRGFDILFSVVLLILLLPVLFVTAIVSAIDTKGNPFFFQWRGGQNGRPFRIIKFRTMNAAAPANIATCQLKNPEQYISRIGKLLRKSSLDELPQLWNILVGDMSFIGPRPVVLTEKKLLGLRHRNGADHVRPGMTGLAQINGRDDLPVYRKARLDAFYAHNMSLSGDIDILIRTVRCVLKADGVNDGPRQSEKEHKSISESPKRKSA